MILRPPKQDKTDVPAKVLAAMDFIRFCEGARQTMHSPFDQTTTEGRKLTKMENEVYDSALICMLTYFEDVDFSQLMNISPEPPEDPPDDPKVPANV